PGGTGNLSELTMKMTPRAGRLRLTALEDRCVPASPATYAVAPAGGGAPVINLLDAATSAVLLELHPFSADFRGEARVAVGDVNGDGRADVVTGAGAGGGPHVRAFSGASGAQLASFYAYAPAFTGGVSVATGDVDRDGLAELFTGAGPGGGPHVKIFGANG